MVEVELPEIEVSEPQEAIISSSKELNLFLAGVGSGKSHTMGIKSANYILNFPEAPGLIAANTHGQLSSSTLVRVYAVWAQYFGLIEDIHFVVDKRPPAHFEKKFEKLKSYSNVISFSNGARVFLASLTKYESIDGLEVAWAMLDETKDTKEEAFKETVSTRVRSKGIWIDQNDELWDHVPTEKEAPGVKVVGFNPIDIFTSPSKVSWLNKMFYVEKNIKEIHKKIFSKTDFYEGEFDDRKIVISSTYHNEHNLPENFIKNKIKLYEDTPGLTETLIFANPIGKSGGEYYAQFFRDRHVIGRLVIDKDLPAHVSFDFNVVPYMPALLMQCFYEDDGTFVIRVLKEYCLKHPKNTTGNVCDEIKFDLAGVCHTAFIYGDASGKNRVTALMDQKSPKHNYDVIKAKLAAFLFGKSMRVPKANPPIAGRRIMHNRAFSGKNKVRIEIDERCEKFIEDLESGKEGPNGEYLKEVVKDRQTKKSYQKNGHLSDAFTYFCWYHLKHLIKIQ